MKNLENKVMLVELEYRGRAYFTKDNGVRVRGLTLVGIPINLKAEEVVRLRFAGRDDPFVSSYIPESANAYVLGDVRHDSCGGEGERYSPTVFLRIPEKYTTSK